MLNMYESLLQLIHSKSFLCVLSLFPLIAKYKYYDANWDIFFFLVWNVVPKNVHFSLKFRDAFFHLPSVSDLNKKSKSDFHSDL